MVDWNDNPEIVRAHLMGTDPDLEMFTYCEEVVCGERGGRITEDALHGACMDSAEGRASLGPSSEDTDQ